MMGILHKSIYLAFRWRYRISWVLAMLLPLDFLGNACGAILVTKHSCANFMPTHDEVMAFIEEHGGF